MPYDWRKGIFGQQSRRNPLPIDAAQLGDRAFYFNGWLKFVALNTNLQRIGELAFGSCTSLEYILIPPSVDVDPRAFFCCDLLNEWAGSYKNVISHLKQEWMNKNCVIYAVLLCLKKVSNLVDAADGGIGSETEAGIIYEMGQFGRNAYMSYTHGGGRDVWIHILEFLKTRW
jgi:hypothetical protein